jgi:hypothetical protein
MGGYPSEPPALTKLSCFMASPPIPAAGMLYVRHDERADRAVITTVPEAHMAIAVLTRLHLLTFEQVAGRDVEPTRTRLH